MIEVEFVKLSNRWFVDIPYNGSVSDLEMVDGADIFLDCYANGRKRLKVNVYDEKDILPYDNVITLYKKEENDYGTTYYSPDGLYRANIWLCKVFNMVIGGIGPDVMYITIKD